MVNTNPFSSQVRRDDRTNLKNDRLYSSTAVVSGNGVKSTIAYYFPGGKEGQLSGIRGYYVCS